MTSKEVGKVFDCSSKAVRNYLKAYDIPVRPNAEAVALERSKWTEEQEAARSKNVYKLDITIETTWQMWKSNRKLNYCKSI